MTDYLKVAKEQLARGFAICPVEPEEKHGKYWWQFIRPTTNLSLAMQHAIDYPNDNVGVVSKRGVGNYCFLDIDADGVTERIEAETGRLMPLTYIVQSSPSKKPWKRHYYFTQTEYSFRAFDKNFSRKDTTRVELSNKENLVHPEMYALKGVGGGAYVVAAGCEKITSDGSVEYYTIEHNAVIIPIPDWLVDWIVADRRKFRSELAKEAVEKTEQGAVVSEEQKYPEADIYWFAYWRIRFLAGNRVAKDRIYDQVIEDISELCDGGEEYVSDPSHREKVRRMIADTPLGKLRFGQVSQATKDKWSRPESSGVVIPVPRPERHPLLVAALKRWARRRQTPVASGVTSEQVYRHLTRVLKDSVTKSPASRQAVSRACRDAGLGYDKTVRKWVMVALGEGKTDIPKDTFSQGRPHQHISVMSHVTDRVTSKAHVQKVAVSQELKEKV